MNQNAYLKQYQKNKVETASKEDLFIMLFDALVNFTKKARTAIEEKNIQKTHNNIVSAQNILFEFINTLDHSVNPELAQRLQSLYHYNIQLLVKANIKKDLAPIDEAIKLLTDLRDTWRQAVITAKKEMAAGTFDSPQTYSDETDGEYRSYEYDG